MRVLVVGGLGRLASHYRAAGDRSPFAAEHAEGAATDIEVDFIEVDCPSLVARAEAADALVLVLGAVSHSAAAKVRRVARARGTPLASVTSPSVSRVRATIEKLASAA